MIAPQALATLIAADPVALLKAAIVQRLADLMVGVRVIDHPGKIDVSEIVARSVVAAPGIAVGWSRLRPARMPDGSFHLAVDLVATVVVEDQVIAGRRVERETVGFAIGRQLLAILADADECLWGRGDVTPPDNADFKPFFTVRDAARGVAYYAATWSQMLTDVGTGLWADAAQPALVTDEDGADRLQFADAATLDAALAQLGFTIPDDPQEAP